RRFARSRGATTEKASRGRFVRRARLGFTNSRTNKLKVRVRWRLVNCTLPATVASISWTEPLSFREHLPRGKRRSDPRWSGCDLIAAPKAKHDLHAVGTFGVLRDCRDRRHFDRRALSARSPWQKSYAFR